MARSYFEAQRLPLRDGAYGRRLQAMIRSDVAPCRRRSVIGGNPENICSLQAFRILTRSGHRMCIAARANVQFPRAQPTTLEASRSGKNRFARLLLDHLVGAKQDRLRHRKAERLGGLDSARAKARHDANRDTINAKARARRAPQRLELSPSISGRPAPRRRPARARRRTAHRTLRLAFRMGFLTEH